LYHISFIFSSICLKSNISANNTTLLFLYNLYFVCIIPTAEASILFLFKILLKIQKYVAKAG